MILLGFIAVYEWEMLLPDRKDYLILTPLPIRTRTIIFAKINALARFLLTFIVAINACPTVLFPNAILVNNAPFFYGLGYMACHGLSVLLGSGLIFLSAIAVQGILLMLFPSQYRVVHLAPHSLFLSDAAFVRTYFFSRNQIDSPVHTWNRSDRAILAADLVCRSL